MTERRGINRIAEEMAEEMRRRGESATSAAAQREPYVNPNTQTFPGGEWQDVPAGTPSPLAARRPAAPVEHQPAMQLDPRVLGGILSMVSGGKIALPTEMLTQPEQRAQIDAAPQYPQLGSSQNPYAGEATPPAPAGNTREGSAEPQDGGDVVDTRRKNSVGNYVQSHKKIVSALAAVCVVASGWGVLRANGQTAGDLTNFVTGQSPQGTLVLAALDCSKPLLTGDVEGQGDIKWKMKVALVSDVAKTKTNKNFKVPTKDAILPTAKLPTVSFPETPEQKELAKTYTDRDLRIMYRNIVEMNACDMKKTAYKNDGPSSVTVNLADVSLIPSVAVPGSKDAAKNAKDEYETRVVTDIKDKTGQYVTAPGEAKRLNEAMKPQKTQSLRNEFFTQVMDGMNEGECKTEIRTQLRNYIEADITQQAKKQNQSVDVKFTGDIKMPGEAYRQGKTVAQIDSKDADIENANISCKNVKLVQPVGEGQ